MSNFDLGLSASDIRRIAWSALYGAIVALIVQLEAGVTDWKVLLGALIGGGLSVIKNAVLADSSRIK